MKFLKILIVEDEIFIAETLKMYLVERGHEIIDIAISYDEALQSYNLRKPDLVLLDIRLYGEKSGIDFANFLLTLSDAPPFIYLTSQFDTRILEMALKTNPYGYLTKPFQKESLWTSVDSAYNLFSNKNGKEESSIISDGKRNHLIKFQEILYVQADHVYSNIFTTRGEKIIVRKSLQQVLDHCICNYLLYCHRSYIVNLNHLRTWTYDEIILDNSMVFPISKTRRDEILLKLKSFNQLT
jgi:two-component system, LytTR family, response regulator LytT